MQKWKYIDESYLDYLRSFEKRIPRSDYGENKLKPFFGELFSVGDLVYVTQVSSIKPRHSKIKEQLDFRKIYDQCNCTIAVVNLNYMFPVPKKCLSNMVYKDIDKYRKFPNESQKNAYIQLLKKELSAINAMDIEKFALKVYDLKKNSPESAIAKRSFDFKQLEVYAAAYNAKSCLQPV